ncbi:roquin-1 isoform X2 [Trichoplusia ni]|uniref:RING-type E3 ubiquitin transferase n=1 Tax=Trichoplusia ni TaxID=7111 RepID=A0A7E5W837_TRINI|nr:roquin-1 isoform X2 [Trichoplusia ni]
MPIQAPQWTDYLNCPVCCREFGAPPRSPISLGCGHTLCKHCLKHLHRKQCPFDQALIQVEPEELVVNTALLQLAGYTPPAQPYHPPSIQALPEHDKQAYDCIIKCMEHLAVYLKYCGNVNNIMASTRLSRPMQRKLVMLLQCVMTDEEGRGRAARAARSLGERTVTELILQHQNPQQLSANLWAAVRARGCQFLGPAMQEEVLKLVLLALEDGSALSRKVLVMFVVQRLEPHFPQASKTSIGHVVQLLYRASCFKVSKRECDSSLMQLKEEFRTYESLRREHDAQIVQIATEAGLRIAPDQWSALLYGDTAHKSHMQSIIDKLQTPQSFAQSVQELFIALQRTGDPAQLIVMSLHLDRLANIDASPDAKSPSWQQLAEVMTSLKEVVAGLIHYLQQQATGRDSNHNQKHPAPERCLDSNTSQNSPATATSTPTHTKYKVSMCRDAAASSFCPRGSACTFAHSEDELERYRVSMNGNYAYLVSGGGAAGVAGAPPPPPGARLAVQPYPPQYALPPPMLESHAYTAPPPPHVSIPQEIGENSHAQNGHQHHPQVYLPSSHPPVIMAPALIGGEVLLPQPAPDDQYYPYARRLSAERITYPFYPAPFVPPQNAVQYVPAQNGPPREDIVYPQRGELRAEYRAEYPADMHPEFELRPEYRVYPQPAPPYRDMHLERRADEVWAPNPGDMYNFGEMRTALSSSPLTTEAFPHNRGAIIAGKASRRASPVEGAGPRAVGGPVSVAGFPLASMPREARELPREPPREARDPRPGDERAALPDRIATAVELFRRVGYDDQALEAGLQELERRIDTEFENAD